MNLAMVVGIMNCQVHMKVEKGNKMKYLVILMIVLWALLCGMNIYKITWVTDLNQINTLLTAINIALTSANIVVWSFFLERVAKRK